jgi:hypothetical protein
MGPGLHMRLSNPLRYIIYNFDVDSDRVKPEHKPWLLVKISPVIRAGGSAMLIG